MEINLRIYYIICGGILRKLRGLSAAPFGLIKIFKKDKGECRTRIIKKSHNCYLVVNINIILFQIYP